MADLQIKEEYLPSRCEVCHQSDCFDPIANYCTRCANLTMPATVYVLPKQTHRYFFAVSTTKLILLSFFTFGLYEIYWFYMNWDIIKDRTRRNIRPVWRSLFPIFFCYELFKEVRQAAAEHNIKTGYSPGLLAVAFILCTFTGRLPDPAWLISFLSVFILLPVQTVINKIHQQATPQLAMNDKYSIPNIIIIALGSMFFLLALIGAFIPE